MAAIAPYYGHSIGTLDAQFGLNADLTGMLIDTCSFSFERDEKEHRNFSDVTHTLLFANPKVMANFSCRILARSTGLANAHPGTAVSRATIAQFRAGTNHGFDLNEGWWAMGSVTHGQPRGDLDEVSFALRLVGYPTNTSGVVYTANPA